MGINSSTIPLLPQAPVSIETDTPDTDDLAQMTFRQACKAWLESRRPFLHPRTYRDYGYCTKWLIKFFGDKRLLEITAEHIRKYQRFRTDRSSHVEGEQHPRASRHHMVNHECVVLRQMLRRVGRWEYVGLGYQPLPLPREKPGRAISDDEERRLLRAGASNPRWEAAYFFALLSLQTTMGPGEVMTLRRKDIDLDNRSLTVNPEGAKNKGRIRLIPLNDIALRVCQEVLAVAEKKGSVLPDHYVFPFRLHGNPARGKSAATCYDPSRPCTCFKTSWRAILGAAGIPKLRMYDLRHTSITRLCENPNNAEEVIEAIAGHLTHQMKKIIVTSA